MNKRPILIIDTDPGHDDALAILLAIKSNRFDIKGITTVAGNSTIQKVTNNARYILDLVNSSIPIFSGSKKPLKKRLILANVHGKSGLDGASITKIEELNNLAIDSIIRIIRTNPKKVIVVCIGPETNLARAILKDPQLPKLIKEVVIMGGAINVPGNKSRVAEFNLFVDPEAAKIVFDAPVKKILVPLDICNGIPLFLSDFQRIEGDFKKPIISMMKKFIKGIEKFENFKGALVYDALATYYLINPKAYTLKPMDIQIETKGELTSGMCVVDKRGWSNKKANVNVVVKIDKKRFVTDFTKILSD